MAKSTTTALDTHLAQEVTTLTTLWTIVRTDGVTVRLTELDRDVVVGSDTYNSSFGYSRTAISITEGLSADDIDLTGLVDDTYVSEDDIKAGFYDGASLVVEMVNYESPDDGTIVLKAGFIGEVIISPNGRYSAELRSLSGKFSQEILEKTSPTCRAELGDTRCTVPVSPNLRQDSTSYSVGDFVRVATNTGGTADEVYENRIYECTTAGTTDSTEPTFSITDGATTTDGTVTWTTRQSWTRNGAVQSVTDNRIFQVIVDETRAVDDWFNLGTLTFNTGPNAGTVLEIKDWDQSSQLVTLFLGAPFTPTSGESVTLVPGCDKLRETCVSKFALSGTTNFANGNVFNFRGEPDLPGRDAVLTYPDAQ